MNNADFVSLYAHTEPFDDKHFILKTFKIYATYDHIKGSTRITIINADTKHECIIYLDYIQREENLIIKVAEAMIKTNLLI